MGSLEDILMTALGVGILLAVLCLLIWVLRGGLRKGKSPEPVAVPISVEELQNHIESWAKSERYSYKVDKQGRLVVRTIRMHQVVFVLIGLALVVFGLLISLIWFMAGNTYFVCTIERYYTGSLLTVESFGSGTPKTVAKLVSTLPRLDEVVTSDVSATEGSIA